MEEHGKAEMAPEFLERYSRVRDAAAERGLVASLALDGSVYVAGTGARALGALGAHPAALQGLRFETEDGFWDAMRLTPKRFLRSS